MQLKVGGKFLTQFGDEIGEFLPLTASAAAATGEVVEHAAACTKCNLPLFFETLCL